MTQLVSQDLDEVGSAHDRFFNQAFESLCSDFRKKMPWLSQEDIVSAAENALVASGM